MSPHASVYISVHGNVIFTFDQLYPFPYTYLFRERERESESERYLQTNKILHDEFRQQMMFYLELHLLIDL